MVVLEGMTTHAGAEKTDGRDVSGGRKEAQRRAQVRARLGSARMGRGSREWRALGDGGGDGEAMWTPTLRPYRVVEIHVQTKPGRWMVRGLARARPGSVRSGAGPCQLRSHSWYGNLVHSADTGLARLTGRLVNDI